MKSVTESESAESANEIPNVLGCWKKPCADHSVKRITRSEADQKWGTERTYSFGNSPSAKEHSSDVFPQAPVKHTQLRGYGQEPTLEHAVANNNQFPPNLHKSEQRWESVPSAEYERRAVGQTYWTLRGHVRREEGVQNVYARCGSEI